jgi:hypothetical protein
MTLTLNLPDSMEPSLREAALEEGVTESQIAEEAVRKFLFLRTFRRVRSDIQAQIDKTYSDEEIFSFVS